MTPQEVKLWVRLRGLRAVGLHFRRQMPLAGYYLDFACRPARLSIELDGHQHGLPDQAMHDAVRDRTVAAEGYRTLRFPNGEVDRNIEGVLESILLACEGYLRMRREKAGPTPVR